MEILAGFWTAVKPQILALAGLIILQVGLAVALALKAGVFEWKKLADFYKTMVLPMLIGWVAFAAFTELATAEILGPTYGPLAGTGVRWLSWLAVVASLGARIVETIKALYGPLAPVGGLDEPK